MLSSHTYCSGGDHFRKRAKAQSSLDMVPLSRSCFSLLMHLKSATDMTKVTDNAIVHNRVVSSLIVDLVADLSPAKIKEEKKVFNDHNRTIATDI